MWAASLLLTLIALAPAGANAQNLIINDLNQHRQSIAYEIPDAEGRAQAIRYIEMVRDRFAPGTEIVDALNLDDDALRAKLKGTVAIYTVLREDSRLLRLASRGLPLRLENGILHWGGRAEPTADLRVVFAGRQPYGEGFSVVYAAGTNALLADAHKVFHGPCSYHIFRGAGEGHLLGEGFYGPNFVEAPTRLPLAAAAADMREFFSTVESAHPNPYAKISKDAYEKVKKQTFAELPMRAAADGTIAIKDLAYSLMYAAAALQDGHTGVLWRPAGMTSGLSRGKRFPPFWLESENGRIFIASAADRSLTGAEMLEVNGQSAGEFLKPVLSRIAAESHTYRVWLFTCDQLAWYYLTNVFGRDSYTLTLRDRSGATRQRPIQTVSLSSFQMLARPRGGGAERRIEFLDSGRIAKLIIPNLLYDADRRKTEEFFDRAFGQIHDKGATRLIIDIRGNGGGDSRMGDYVLQFLRGAGPSTATHFNGKTYLLIDHSVFSSAVMFAGAFRDYKVGTLVGYESGGTPSHYGYPRNFTLKNSGIAFRVSRTHFQSATPRPDDDRHGVLPDIPITRELLAPYQSEPDPALAFTLAAIRKGH